MLMRQIPCASEQWASRLERAEWAVIDLMGHSTIVGQAEWTAPPECSARTLMVRVVASSARPYDGIRELAAGAVYGVSWYGTGPGAREDAFAGTWLTDPAAPLPAVPWSEAGDAPPEPVPVSADPPSSAGAPVDLVRLVAGMKAPPPPPPSYNTDSTRPVDPTPIAPGDEVDIPF